MGSFLQDSIRTFTQVAQRLLMTVPPLRGGGDLSADRTLTVDVYDGTNPGVVPPPGPPGSFLASDGTWQIPAGGGGGGTGTVTSVGLAAPSEFVVSGSPVTTSGTLTLTKNTETAHAVWAGPVSGSPAIPVFRPLDATDIPPIPESTVINLPTDLAGKASIARLINTTLPLTGGGDLTADITLAVNSMTGDSGSGGSTGVVPAPPAGSTAAGDFLKADGTWAIPPQFAGVSLISSSYSVAATDNNKLLVVNTSGAITFTLPNPPPSPIWLVYVENPTPGTLQVSPNGLLMDGASGTLTVTKNQGAMIATDGTNYYSERGMGTGGGGGAGTVTSVGLTMPAEFTVAGSPVTAAGTLAVTSAAEAAHTVWAGPVSGAAATPSFRTLTAADIPAGYVPGVHSESLTDGNGNFIFAAGDIVTLVGVPN